MNVTIFTKTEKPTVKEAIDYLERHFTNVTIYQGKRDDPFPVSALDESPDILISYLSPWIIPLRVLSNTKLYNINFHPAPPEYPGTGCFNFAIYNDEKVYGATSHLMEEKVDTGKIIGVKRFPLLETDSVYNLSIKTYGYMLALFYEIINFLLTNKTVPHTNEKWARKPCTRKELESLCKIDVNMSENEIKRRIKATYYPGMPGPYFEVYGYKFQYITIR
jgi:methionyl-tRNA formyltransferase